MSKTKKAVFLDRDGVINRAYQTGRGGRPPNHAGELDIFPGVPEAIRLLNEEGFLVFVVTNQGGVGLGYMTQADLDEIHRHLTAEIEAGEGQITEIRACIHKPKAGCSCRKPKPGMLLALAHKYNVDLSNSYMIGDRDMDLAAGQSAGTKTILIKSKEKTRLKPDHVCANLKEAAKLILQLEKST